LDGAHPVSRLTIGNSSREVVIPVFGNNGTGIQHIHLIAAQYRLWLTNGIAVSVEMTNKSGCHTTSKFITSYENGAPLSFPAEYRNY
jgi:hypothetical protein